MIEILKPYYHKIQAVVITRKNYQRLKEIDVADGVLEDGNFEDFEGDWFVRSEEGNSIIPGNINLIKVRN